MRRPKWKRQWRCPRCGRRFRLQRGEYWDTELCPGCWHHQQSRSRKRPSPTRYARTLKSLGWDAEAAMKIATAELRGPPRRRGKNRLDVKHISGAEQKPG